MNFLRLRSSITAVIDDDFKRLAHTVDNCPFYVHVKGGGLDSDTFHVFFSLSKHEPYNGSSNVLAHAVCTVLPNLYEGTVMMKVALRQTKKELGRREHKWDEHDWTRQDWRYDPFFMECAAAPLWNLMERSVDFQRLAKCVAAEVMEEEEG